MELTITKDIGNDQVIGGDQVVSVKQQEQEDLLSEDLVPSSALSSASNLSSSIEGEEATLDSMLGQIEMQFSRDNVPYLVEELYQELNNAYDGQSDRAMLSTETVAPSGLERGTFLAIDLGGSTLKVCVISLLGESKYRILARKTWEISNDRKVINLDFFRMMCDCVEEVLKMGRFFDDQEIISTGISWSFPFTQTSPNNGYIYVVSKGYSLDSDTKGKNLADLFSNAMLQEKGITVRVHAVVNDAVSVYLSGSYAHSCCLGLVLGTGTNASFVVGNRVVNSELSFFGSCFASILAKNSIDRGVCSHYADIPLDNYMRTKYGVYQPLEYICGGRYLGETFRLGVVQGASSGELFEDQFVELSQCSAFTTPYHLQTDVVSKISECSYIEAKALFDERFALELSVEDHVKIKRLVDVLTDRAATVMASMLMACAKFVNDHFKGEVREDKIRIDFVGSLLQYYTEYRKSVEVVLDRFHEQLGLPAFELIHIDDSSILGAAVSAAAFKHLLS
ncbi:hypothetical protein FOA43_001978 [Brettanomyces nanus]|uniref:Phosphotransferase n=1 Tax=Eeniella nana TaxID=13502 RepID=A0A875RZQ1_EENNA|nr:uncharacterized protein FOA43_001978 [Brettanomyces nanus]QPG74646.1 hypothetical protein FOA43_001978 [Brettanomyces nanus]